jgi:hypothetical protein
MEGQVTISTHSYEQHGALKPIETQYKGYRFRSRLEARWAVFFDALGIRWEYEPEGFDLGFCYYLPDFLLYPPEGLARVFPEYYQNTWIEIKPVEPTPDDVLKLTKIIHSITDHHGVFLWSNFSLKTAAKALHFYHHWIHGAFIADSGGMPYIWSFAKRALYDDVIAAFTAARSARFEHGERPRV